MYKDHFCFLTQSNLYPCKNAKMLCCKDNKICMYALGIIRKTSPFIYLSVKIFARFGMHLAFRFVLAEGKMGRWGVRGG